MECLKQLFASWAGEPCVECLALGANGSSRRYYRLSGATRHCIGTVAGNVRENEAFFSFTRHFRAKGMPVPELYVVHEDRQHYLQQDLGDTTLYCLLLDKRRQGGGFDAEMLKLYKQVLQDLDALQKAGRDLDFSKGFPRAAFDRRAMLWDLDYFKHFFLKLNHIDFDEDTLQDDFEHFTDLLLEADCSCFMYRDFNPRNIMVASPPNPLSCEERGSLGVRPFYIDYQGGRRGAAQYDVASLLYSAKSDLPEALREELLRHYASLHGDPDFMTYFWPYLLMRIMQTLGAYGYRGLYERKPYFIESIPLAINNLRHVVESHPLPVQFPELNKVIARVIGLSVSKESSSPSTGTLTVEVQSFSYKQGLPTDLSGNGGGHVFDCRALPNPGRYPEYRSYTGKDRPVQQFLEREPAVDVFLSHAEAIVAQSVEKYLERNFTHLSVAFGCTGGQHRSVYCAEQLAARIARRYPSVHIHLHHREQ